MNKVISSTTASFAAGSAGAVIVELVKEILQSDLSWQQVVLFSVLAVTLVAGAAVLNHGRYKEVQQ